MAARAHGDGAVYPVKTPAGKTRYRGAVVVGWKRGPTGKDLPVRKYVSADSKAECARLVRKVIKDRDAGRTAWTTAPTVADWLAYWLDDIAGPALRPNTLAGYRAVAARLTAHVGPRLRLDQLTPQHLDQLYRAMLDDGLSPTTVRLHHRVIGRALTLAVKRDRLHTNPTDRVEPPSARAYNARALSVDEVRRILDTAATRGETTRWLLALLLGMRQGEVLALSWTDIDWDQAVLTCTYSLSRAKGAGIVMDRTKADRERPLPLPPILVDALRAHRTEQMRARLRAGARWVGWSTTCDGRGAVDLVFATRRGTPVSREDDWRAWRDLLAAAGVPHTREHDARVSTATLMGQAGVHPRVAMEILGHGDMAMTTHYTKVPSASARAAIEAVAGLIAR